LLQPLAQGLYDAYVVRDPVTTVTFGAQNAAVSEIGNQRVQAITDGAEAPVVARVNWHPRWQGSVAGTRIEVRQRDDGYLELDTATPVVQAELHYTVQPADWVARGLALAGIAGLGVLANRSASDRPGRRWYARAFAGPRSALGQAEQTTEKESERYDGHTLP
jgi:hypothetical protein